MARGGVDSDTRRNDRLTVSRERAVNGSELIVQFSAPVPTLEGIMKQLDEIETLFAQLENRICAWWGYVDDDNRYLFPRADEYEQKKNDAKAIIEKRLRSTEAALAQKDEEIARLEALLTRKDEEYAWTISPAMASARIDELNTQMVTLSDVLRTIQIMCAPHSSVLARDICRLIGHTLKEAS